MSIQIYYYEAEDIKKTVTARQVAIDANYTINGNACVAEWRNGDNNTAIHFNEDGTYHDFVKGEHGDCIRLYQHIHNLDHDFKTALQQMGDRYCPHLKKQVTNSAQPPENPAMATAWAPVNLPKNRHEDLIALGYKVTAIYPYKDADGTTIYEVHRHEKPGFDKETLPFMPSLKRWGLPDKPQRLLYNLPEVMKPENTTVYLNEGEKCAQACIDHGLCGTTSGSSSSWQKQFAEMLRGKKVVILRDYDDPGMKYALTAALDLLGVAASVKILPTCLEEKGDVYDFFQNGGSVEKLLYMVDQCPITTEANRAELEEDLKALKDKDGRAATSAANGALGGRPQSELDLMAADFMETQKDKEGRKLLNYLNGGWLVYRNGSWIETTEAHVTSEVTTFVQNQNKMIDKLNQNAHKEYQKKCAEQARINPAAKKPEKPTNIKRLPTSSSTFYSITKNLISGNFCRLPDIALPAWLDRPSQPERPNGIGWINLENCLLDVDAAGAALAEGRAVPEEAIRQHTPLFITQHVQMPVSFVPSAKCPKFDKFLREILPNEESREAVQMYAGYCLMAGDHRYNCFMLLYDAQGGTGKGTLLKVLKTMLGEKNVSAVRFSDIGERFQIAGLANSMLNIDEDMAAISTADASDKTEGLLKQLTSGDLLSFERKGIDAYFGRASCQLLFVSNTLPAIRDRSGALLDRFRIVHFNQRFRGTEKQNPRLSEELTTPEELQGVLLWALMGWGKLRKLPLFPDSEESKALKRELQETCQPEVEFIRETFMEMMNAFVGTKDAYDRYKAWANDMGHRAVGDRRFLAAIKLLFPKSQPIQKKQSGKSVRGIDGIDYQDRQRMQEECESLLGDMADDSDLP